MKAEQRLAELVFEILRQTEGVSIAGMVRELRKRDVQAHRLTVTGYLHALADAGYLEVQSVPPTKLFTLKRAPHRNVHAAIGEAARAAAPNDPAAVELAVAAAQRLLDRPVFLSEVAEMGFSRTTPLRQLGKKERADAVKRMEAGGVRVREGEPLFEPKDRHEVEVARLLDDVILNAFSCRSERPRATRQMALTLDRFE